MYGIDVSDLARDGPDENDEQKKLEKEKERKRIEELTQLYKYTLAKAEREGNADDWSELRGPRELTWSESVLSFLGLQGFLYWCHVVLRLIYSLHLILITWLQPIRLLGLFDSSQRVV